MDFAFTPEEEAFRQEIRDFLKQELPEGWVGPASNEELLERDDLFALGRKLAPKLAQKGWLTMGWPKEYGGQERSHIAQTIFREEMCYNVVPGIDISGTANVGPTILAYGTEEQKKQHLLPIARGEVVWCQGFSEPEAGSDLASLRTRADDMGDHFLLNGQKVWTTGGHRADWMYVLARTDLDAPKHEGISILLLDLKTAGVEIRPLHNIIGGHVFNEVFFDNVRVPKDNLVGRKNQGWAITTSLLNLERSGVDRVANSRRILDDLIAFTRETLPAGLIPHHVDLIRQKLGGMAIECEVARLLCYRVAWLQQQGQLATMEASAAKIFGSELMQRVSSTGMQILGLYGQLDGVSPRSVMQGRVPHFYQSSRGRTISAGTNEIQRTLIATRGLGLPRG
ncbi:MAG: acyl-CoA dehydrogenase family protein [Dehalococcoidia bacterium]